MDFRQFLFDEYKYVDKHKSLHDIVKPRNIPTERRDQNTVATKMKKIQAFFNELIEKGELSVSPFIYLGKNKKRTMMRETMIRQYSCRKMNSESERYRGSRVITETKDAFVLQCAFGCLIP